MLNSRNVGIVLFVGLISVVYLISLAGAATSSIMVPAGGEVNRKIDLKVDDQVVIKFTVVGAEDSFVSFSIVYPNATEVSFGEIGLFSHSFVCDAKGEYELSFVNNDVSESKLVTLNYEIEHYIFGIPQMLFLALVIAAVCVIMVAFYVLLGPSM